MIISEEKDHLLVGGTRGREMKVIGDLKTEQQAIKDAEALARAGDCRYIVVKVVHTAHYRRAYTLAPVEDEWAEFRQRPQESR